MQDHKHYWLKSGSYNMVLNIQALLFGFGGFYLLVRMLDKHHYGIWTLFVAITTIFEMARNGLIQNALIKFLSEGREEDKPKIISASFVLSGLLMLACILLNISLAGYFSRLWHFPELVNMFLMFNLVYVLQGLLAQFQWIEQANLQFRGILITTIIRQGGYFLYIFLSFIFHWPISLMNLIYVQGLCAALATCIQYFVVQRILFVSYQWHYDWVKKLFNYGKYVFGTFISSILANTINQMMLGTMISPDAAGSYNVALRIASLADIPTNALGTIVFPQSAKRFAEKGKDSGKYLYEKSVGTILALLLPFVLFIFIFPGFVVRIIAGANYTDAIPLVRFVILTFLLNPFIRLFGTILDSIGRPRINFLITIIFTILILTLSYIMIRHFGIMGCVYGTLLADIAIVIVMQIIMYKELNVNVLNTFIYAGRFYPEFLNSYIRPLLRKRLN
jgi:lipopolysaccharide exporter